MKKFFGLFLLSMCLFADQEGVIEQIDDKAKTITVSGTLIKVLPNTQIEEDSCWLPWDISRKFTDLKVGDIVEVDLFHFNNMPTASKIEIQCIRERAY